MKRVRIFSALLALSMILSVAVFASPPTHFDDTCPYCEGGAEAVGTRDWVVSSTQETPCTHGDSAYTDVITWIDVDVQFECWTCGRHYTRTLTIPYTCTCGKTGSVTYSEEACYFGLGA